MRESFSEYKKTIDLNLQNCSFLYSGDIISSTIEKYSQDKTTPLTSPNFIISALVDIYNKSWSMMVERSKEVIIAEEGIEDAENFMDKILSKTTPNLQFIFGSNRGKKILRIFAKSNTTRSLPEYFYLVDSFFGTGGDFLVSPLILEEEGEFIFYVTDAPIQSLVWSIQNMDYTVEPTSETPGFIPTVPSIWKHTITYNLYDCKFNSWKVVVKNISKIRNDKINQLLDGN